MEKTARRKDGARSFARAWSPKKNLTPFEKPSCGGRDLDHIPA
jgi:hypothetical protein